MPHPPKIKGALSDDDIANELNRVRQRNIEAEIATAKVRARSRRENLQARKRQEILDKKRLKREYENSLHHLKAFAHMYDNSPYRYDVLKMRTKQRNKRLQEEKDLK